MRKVIFVFFVCLGQIGIAQESYVLSAESVLTIAGTSTVHDWEVTANTFAGSLTISDEAIDDLKIEVPVAEIKSERGPTMDKKMYAALKGEEHPSVTFVLNEVKEKKIFIGRLTIAGAEKEISVKGKIERGTGKISVSGAQEILLNDYGIEPPTAMFGQIVVGDTVTVKFDLVFQRG